ncbi:MAG: hypothetical protein ACJA13_001081 [Paraglaciecola sp.]|jgi:hypothetical protein
MQLHIFIATTGGLVAVQNIQDIDDAEIHSLISVNGTSTTANISGAYHQFVKKGAGIIQQDFGGCSYRLNLSARIDHGNSWQLAVYLAHIAHQQEILGNGNVQPGDQVICATGEVNTSTREVQAVEQVPLKLQLAAPSINQWRQQGIKVVFLLPQTNAADVEAIALDYLVAIDDLEQAIASLPTFAASALKDNNLPAEQGANNKALITTTQSLRPLARKWLTATVAMLILVVAAAVLLWPALMKNDAQTLSPRDLQNAHQQNSSQTLNSATTEVEDKVPTQAVPQVEMLAYHQGSNGCIDQLTVTELAVTAMQFQTVRTNSLCKLVLFTQDNIQSVTLIAADTRAVRELLPADGRWQIPLPSNMNYDRQYFLLVSPIHSDEVQRAISILLTQNKKSPKLGFDTLRTWRTSNNIQGQIYGHKLERF